MTKKPARNKRRRTSRARARSTRCARRPEGGVASLAGQITKLLTAEPDHVAEKAEKELRRFFKIQEED